MAKKVQISIDDALLAKIDDYAKKNYMSRSGVIALGTSQLINQQMASDSLIALTSAMKAVAEQNGTVDPETMKKLSDFEALTSMLKA